MQLIWKYDKGIRYLLFSIKRFSKYAWVASLKVKKGIIIVNAFHSILDSSKKTPKNMVMNFIIFPSKNG